MLLPGGESAWASYPRRLLLQPPAASPQLSAVNRHKVQQPRWLECSCKGEASDKVAKSVEASNVCAPRINSQLRRRNGGKTTTTNGGCGAEDWLAPARWCS